jgi:hypothetical protein
MTPTEYLVHLKTCLVTSSVVASFDIVEEWNQPDRGYLRVRATLANGDFLEAAEYFVASAQVVVTERYSCQWMDCTRMQLRRRWDNVEHHPELPNFPHHIHCAGGRVEPGVSLSIQGVLDQIAESILPRENAG